MQNNAGDSAVNTRPSHLFYVTRLRRPLVDRAEGIYLWTQDGRRFIDGSSGPVAVNLGYGNRHVLDAMKRQMEKTTFAYRLHFENEPAEELARDLAGRMPGGLDRIFFVSGGSEAVESCIKLARQWAVATGQPKRWKVIGRMPSYHGGTLWRAGGDRRRHADRQLRRPDAHDADDPGADRLPRPRQPVDGTARREICRHAGGEDPRRGAGERRRLHHGADRRRGHQRAGRARQLLSRASARSATATASC